MLFNSYNFILFFAIVLIVYFAIPPRIRYIWLLLSSYYFYASWNMKATGLLLFSTITVYLAAIAIEKARICERKKWAKGSFWLCLAANLGILVFFKYSNFLMENLRWIFELIPEVNVPETLNIYMPIGISFYTFTAVGYLIDVYRGKAAQRNFGQVALFVSFFPNIISGPIERYDGLLKQIKELKTVRLFDYQRITQGIIVMLWGYFLKMVIADRAAIFVDGVFDYYWMYGSIELIMASILYALQIYCDFASYSLIALGAAKIMGLNVIRNFDTPYLAVSIKDFWRRWHISLSSWLRDYIYISLGGSRCSKIRRYVNLMITFLVSGIWHGASWNYIAWGGATRTLSGCRYSQCLDKRKNKEQAEGKYRLYELQIGPDAHYIYSGRFCLDIFSRAISGRCFGDHLSDRYKMESLGAV